MWCWVNMCEKTEVNEYPEIIAGCVKGASKGNHESIKEESCRHIRSIKGELTRTALGTKLCSRKPTLMKGAILIFDLTLTWPVAYLRKIRHALESLCWELSIAACPVSLRCFVQEITRGGGNIYPPPSTARSAGYPSVARVNSHVGVCRMAAEIAMPHSDMIPMVRRITPEWSIYTISPIF